MAESVRPSLRFTGHDSFTSRLVLATLTGRTIQISKIRPNSTTAPGLAAHEISFLRLLESVTNGSHIEISYTGTTLLYKPGLITGSSSGLGASIDGSLRHDIPPTNSRGLSYFLIPLCLLAPFSKNPFNVFFSGSGVITSSTITGDMSVDSVRTAILPLYAQFGISNKIELRINKRSNAGRDGSAGGGEVQLLFGRQVRLPKTIHLLNPGRVKRIRGVAYATGVSASNNARMIEVARGILNPFVSDTYIFSDVSSAPLVSLDPKNPTSKRKVGLGYGLSLVAESSTGALYSADLASSPQGGDLPEDIGSRCAYQLLETVSYGGMVPPSAAPTMLTLMAMGSEDVGRIVLGSRTITSPAVVALARDLSLFGSRDWGVRAAPKPSVTSRDDEDDSDDDNEDNENGKEMDVVVGVFGSGVGNVGRKIA